jgi:tRNA A-37 threonylcarbamoyl transferase component Bud32
MEDVERHMKNPFTAGKWVRGPKFFGRRELLEKVLHGSRNYLWVAGTRRLGKTSLLKQLEYLTQSSPLAEEYVPLSWDLAGSEDVAGLKVSILEGVEAAEKRFEEIGVGVDELEKLSDVFEILRYLERKARSRDRKLMLLCDECEELIKIEKSCPEALPRLRRVLQQGETLHTVLAASRRLGALERSTVLETSPFLHGFVPPLYLPRLNDDEARALIQLGDFAPRDVQVIMEKTDNHPYLIQLVCERFFEAGNLDRVIDELRADNLVSDFLAVDFKHLDPLEKNILEHLVRQPQADAGTLATRLGVSPDRIEAALWGLRQLGCVKEVGSGLSISNFFFEAWLRDKMPDAAESIPPDLPKPGDQLGHHLILEQIGSTSGMAVVYKARDLDLERLVALKAPLPKIMSDPQFANRFMREARTASILNHPNIATVYEVGKDRGHYFISMELVEGRTFRLWRHEEPDDFSAQVDALIQAGKGLAAAHAKSVVHRDIKPDNVMITEEGVVKIIDFGLARPPRRAEVLTTTEIPFGTPPYMSPEQWRGEPIDHRTDIFSFGVLMYELFTGERPFQGDDVESILSKILNKDPRPIREVNPRLPEATEAIVARALKKDKAERYQSMLDLVADLERLGAGPIA